jgi:SNF2 family DNA or RNA helicase
MSVHVALDLLPDGRTSVRPVTHRRYSIFLETLRAAGGRRDTTAGVHVCERDQTPALATGLRARNFEPVISARLQAALTHVIAEQEARRAAAQVQADAAAARVSAAGADMRPYQREAVAWLGPRTRALLADDMGLGKSLEVLMSVPPMGSVCVICPAVVKTVWCEEAERWRPDLRPVLLDGRGSFRWPKPSEMVVANYDILAPTEFDTSWRTERVPTQLGHPPMGMVLVADEAHMLRNATTQRAKRFKALSRAALQAGGRVWLVTATPMLGKPIELYNVLRAASLEAEAFGTWSEFCRLFNVGKDRWGHVVYGRPDPSVPERLGRVCLRRRREDVLPQLPAMREREILIPNLDDATRRICDEALNALREAGIELSDSILDLDLSNAKAVWQRIASARAALATAKIPAMLELVASYEEAREPLVVFSAHRPPIDLLGARAGWCALTGSVHDPEVRAQMVRDFRDAKYRGFAATIEAGGVGITLCGGVAQAAHALMVDLSWTPALNAQAAARIHRLGQTRGTLLTRLVADHALDRHVNRVVTRKMRMIAATVPATSAGTGGPL